MSKWPSQDGQIKILLKLYCDDLGVCVEESESLRGHDWPMVVFGTSYVLSLNVLSLESSP